MTDIWLSFKDDVTLTENGPDRLQLKTSISRTELTDLSAGAMAVLHALADGGLTDPGMRALVAEHDGPSGMFKFFQIFPRLVSAGAVCYTLHHDDAPLLTLVPASPYFRRNKDEIPPDARFQLSRFAYVHLENGQILLESARGFARLVIHETALMSLVGLLATPQSWTSAADTLGNIPPDVMHVVFQFLRSVQALTEPQDGTTAEDANTTLRQWDFHDLLFHARTRYGRYDKPFDGTVNRFFGDIPMPPAVKPAMTETAIDLHKPTLDALRASDPPLIDAMEMRRTLYNFDHEQPITTEQIGDFLYRVARVRGRYGEEHTAENGYSEYMEYTHRPYPGGGAMYELECYITVNQCTGLEPGIYHYHAEAHQLHQLAPLNPMVGAVISDAGGTTPTGQPPQVLITLTARFPRMFWKYNTLGYALILKNVGVLYQSMYLVATAMQLAPIAMGAGNSDLFAEAAGLDYYAETSVGEFGLSSRAD